MAFYIQDHQIKPTLSITHPFVPSRISCPLQQSFRYFSYCSPGLRYSCTMVLSASCVLHIRARTTNSHLEEDVTLPLFEGLRIGNQGPALRSFNCSTSGLGVVVYNGGNSDTVKYLFLRQYEFLFIPREYNILDFAERTGDDRLIGGKREYNCFRGKSSPLRRFSYTRCGLHVSAGPSRRYVIYNIGLCDDFLIIQQNNIKLFRVISYFYAYTCVHLYIIIIIYTPTARAQTTGVYGDAVARHSRPKLKRRRKMSSYYYY